LRNVVSEHKIDDAEMKELREIIGHSPAEATIGMLLGIGIAIVVWLLMV
jgi:acid phosphatase family membrane protein YuiD